MNGVIKMGYCNAAIFNIYFDQKNAFRHLKILLFMRLATGLAPEE